MAKIRSLLFFTLLLFTFNTHAARLAIVIDDVGYRVNEDNKLLQLPVAVSIAILPNSPYGRKIAEKAHQQGREILIHLPMAPLSQQPLEKNTLHPAMSREEIARIMQDAIQKVPYAVGMNNHMGSAMTSNLRGMEKVMQVLSQSRLYFLDSVTIGNTQVTKAAMGTPVPVLRRHVFLDNIQTEAETRHQLNRAIALARRQGSAIAIGHPHPTTMCALQQALARLPHDIELVTPGMLLNDVRTTHNGIKPRETKPVPETQWKSLKRVKKILSDNALFNTLNRYMQKLWDKQTGAQHPRRTA
ncbi:divergent polysaccharide deacetylase family protein [Xenorhabdus sp. DI]|uniref:divergent polysaccharide deacetylase family protein n=1 Tax=Xenorhabdus doucetiae TaxID=351671 RepID=UPI00199CF24B|nr:MULTISPECIES: divergent polysaccharide deacetylase family protein [unclassified Xenorhabdus]MBD2785761.1 divergent polysaccharide deacetylase family protein [Xenorhabdus sp. 3]MBD2789150.1 divergent polysaccharide deacetylase family protein [Xenorhabdus sp. DI]